MPAILTPLLISTVVGAGLATAGTIQQTKAAQQSKQFNQQIVNDEQRQAALQKQQQDLQAERYRMQVIRQSNVARSLALSNATASGAQYGSGLPGGYGQISGESNTNLVNSFENQALGNQFFGITGSINNSRLGQAQANANYSTGAGLSSLGGTLISIGPTLNNLAGINPGTSSGNPYNPYTANWLNGYKGSYGY